MGAMGTHWGKREREPENLRPRLRADEVVEAYRRDRAARRGLLVSLGVLIVVAAVVLYLVPGDYRPAVGAGLAVALGSALVRPAKESILRNRRLTEDERSAE